MCLELEKMGIPIKYHHPEVGASGQFEIEPMLGQMSKMADATMMIKYCTIIVSTLPILCVYPFLQKYFAKGVMIGSVKE